VKQPEGGRPFGFLVSIINLVPQFLFAWASASALKLFMIFLMEKVRTADYLPPFSFLNWFKVSEIVGTAI